MARLATVNKDMAGPTIDPVCGMRVATISQMIISPSLRAKLVTTYEGKDYHFCAEACRRAFEKNPEKYLKRSPIKIKGPQGWLGRYLERMARANSEQFGGGAPRCH
jgi:YHS domain-containing protein